MSSSDKPPADAARQFLELYYPIHYRAGIGVEDALRGEKLNRHQVAILWLIHSEGEAGQELDRKVVEQALVDWFGITPAAVTKAVKSMTGAPLKLIRLREHPASGRQKRLMLTSAGRKQMDLMIARGTDHVQRIIDEMSPAQIRAGLKFFEKITAIIDGWDEKSARE